MNNSSGSISLLNNNGRIIGGSSGVYNDPGSLIGTLNNTGTITGLTEGINNNGTITNLNNAQGVGNTNGALTYKGALPTNYNIIINSAINYGQLSGISVTGSTNFGIYAGGVNGVAASVIAKGTYSRVLSGMTSANLAGTTAGNYNGFTWRLNNSSGSIWDLIVTGASTTDT